MKISVCSLSYNDEVSVDMYLDSALTFADEIVIVDGGSTDKTVDIIKQFQEKYPEKINLIIGPEIMPEAYQYPNLDKFGRVLQNGNFGMMKQIAYNHATGDWIFYLDLDEAVSDNARELLLQIIENNDGVDCYDVEYIHFVHDFSHIDNSEPVHLGISRFHKRREDVTFPYYNHALPMSNFNLRGQILKRVMIYHLGYAKNLFDIWERYKRNIKYSEIHPGMHQYFWRDWHYFDYAVKRIEPKNINIPQAILKRFEIGIYQQ